MLSPARPRAVVLSAFAAIALASSVTASPAAAAPNSPPKCTAFIGDSTGTVKAGQPIDVGLRCTDPDRDRQTYSVGRAPGHATLSNFDDVPRGGGDVDYAVNFYFKPARDYDGPDSFTIRIDDGHNHVVDVLFAYTIDNYAPQCRVTGLTTGTGSDLEAGKLATGRFSCFDEENDPFTIAVKTQPAHGSPVTLTPDDASGHGGTVSFTPDADYRGPDSFSFQLKDAFNDVIVGFPVNIVGPDNAAPTCNDITSSVTQPRSVTLTGDCADREDATLAYEVVGQPSHGTVTSDGSGGFTYTPAPDFIGQDSFTYDAVDSSGARAEQPATATIDVTGVKTILIWPKWASPEVGRPHYVGTFVRHADGRPWAGQTVAWKITRDDAAVLRGSATTNRYGLAVVSWRRASPGTDGAVIWVDRNRNGRIDAHEPSEYSTAVWRKRDRRR